LIKIERKKTQTNYLGDKMRSKTVIDMVFSQAERASLLSCTVLYSYD
jgi:hypothetical protein